LPPVGLTPLRPVPELAQAALAEPAVSDDGDLVVAGELLLQVFVQLRPLAGHDEHELRHDVGVARPPGGGQ